MPDLPVFFKFEERLHRFVERRVVVAPMNQHEINYIRAQAFQTTLRAFNDIVVLAVHARDAPTFVVESDLRDQHNFVAPGSQRFPKNFLGVVWAVHFCCVEEIDAVVDGGVDGSADCININIAIHRRAHGPRAKPDGRTFEVGISEGALNHCGSSLEIVVGASIR